MKTNLGISEVSHRTRCNRGKIKESQKCKVVYECQKSAYLKNISVSQNILRKWEMPLKFQDVESLKVKIERPDHNTMRLRLRPHLPRELLP